MIKKYKCYTGRRKFLLHSGNIRTLDPTYPRAQAMVIDGSEITWLGNNDDIVAIPLDEYQLINLSGRTVLPSFTDAHVHFAFFAQSLVNLNLDGCKSYREALGRIRKFAAKLSKNEWLIGKGWSKDSWKDARLPHKSDLDKIIPNNPAAIFSKDEHLLWTNSLGLKIGGIDSAALDPDGGRIARDKNGEPTGILMENACALVLRHCRRLSKKKAFDLINNAITECHKKGVTSVGNFDDIENFALLQDYHNRKNLKIRIRQYIPVRFLDHLLELKLRSGFGSRYLKIAGIKIFADGALGSQTALMFEPYRGSRKNIGIEVTTEKEMTDIIKAAASNGIACAVHAIGDRANHQVLNAFEKLPLKYRKLRHRIEHVQIIRPDDLRRFVKLNVIASVQPSHCSSDIDLARKYWGGRSKFAYNFRSLIDSKAKIAFGSDAPIERLDPIEGIYSAVTRKSFDGGKSFHPKQRLTIGEAVAGFTSGAAYCLADEELYGTIALGKSADIIIMNEDPFWTKPYDLRDLEILATFFEGECVYGWDNINS